MRTGRQALLISAVITTVLVGGVVATGVAGPLFSRVDQAYARWRLEARIDDFWEARKGGDVVSAAKFILPSCESRGGLGSAVRYWNYEVHEIALSGDQASVTVDTEYSVALPGFDSGPGSKRKLRMLQKWVRSEGTWYWDPGPEDKKPSMGSS